jgi:F0F1-type ATP synthase assembly protein I
MKKFLFLIVASLFIFSGVFGAESLTESIAVEKENRKQKVEFSVEKAQKDIDQIVGGILLIGGLLLYLIVGAAPWLGIIVMVIGIVLLLYGALKKFF